MTSYIEQKYVIDFYNTNVQTFNDTRYAPWPVVKTYIDSLPAKSSICDIGCGNGKNQYRTDLNWSSCDNSTEMVSLMKQRHDKLVELADCTSLPYDDQSFDSVICIAVVHHLFTDERRTAAFKEIKRILKKNGTALISVWGSQPTFGNGDQLVKWNHKEKQRYIHFFTYDEIHLLVANTFSDFHISKDFNNYFIHVVNC